jgi:hypothetical protein
MEYQHDMSGEIIMRFYATLYFDDDAKTMYFDDL